MEGNWGWEQKILIGELIHGMELAKQLKQNLSAKSSPEAREFLVQRILSSYEKALSILKWSGGSMGQQQQPPLGVATSFSLPESPISNNASPQSENFDRPFKDNQDLRDVSKKRKTMPRWTDQVRVSSENGLEGPQEDGYSWRKYGQKDILGAKYPRSYYRCTFRNTQNCWATKQVQRTDEDPYLFEITYRGTHSCSQAGNSVQPPKSPEKQDQKPNNQNMIPQQQQFEQSNPKFQSNLRVITDELGFREVMESPFSFPSSSYGCMKSEDSFTPLVLDNDTFLGGFSQSFVSPATPESNYYPLSPFQMSSPTAFHNVQRSESDHTEIISANNSVTNSPIPEMNFSLDLVNNDPNFPLTLLDFSSI
ncbi:probable WRKY transcription factor 53 [Humulus lupulus]|uniref:probable WRKY transcription factor 53 n=1 Tax=Humulus lupulus TaxID=3486 RepID=UPI002B403447|nr:probable WRKY transcription factor 53 [Humulus lupulus]